MRRRPLLVAAVLVPLALAGCSADPVPSATPSTAPTEAADAEQRLDGPHLIAEGRVFDPAVDDVDPDGECAGADGRETLATFDRAAWPALDVAAGAARLACGNASGAGWRHIADGHTGDFDELAALVDADWEDVAWFAIDRALEQPTRVEAYRDDIVNYDVLVEHVDGGEVERSWMVTVGVGLGSGQIITSFPDEQR